ncbi:MAG: hypothetical protein ACI8RD_006918 [Bacillariaceae sp.]|jgi:hypothetical protein
MLYAIFIFTLISTTVCVLIVMNRYCTMLLCCDVVHVHCFDQFIVTMILVCEWVFCKTAKIFPTVGMVMLRYLLLSCVNLCM